MFSDSLLKKLVLLFTILYISLIWIFPYPPLTDYPNNLGIVHIINQVIHGNEYLSEYFSFNFLTQGTLPYIFMLVFAQFFSIEVTGKLFLTCYILLFVYSIFYFFSTFAKENKYLYTLFSFLFIFNRLFYISLPGFILSVPVFLLLLSIWFKNKKLIYVTIFPIILYFFHFFSVPIFILSLVILERNYLKKIGFYLSLIPTIFVIFCTSILSDTFSFDFVTMLSGMLSFKYLFYTLFDFILSISLFSFPASLFFLLCFLFFIIGRYKFDRKNPFIVLILVLFLVCILIPSSIYTGTSYLDALHAIKDRILFFLFPILVVIFPKVEGLDKKIFFSVGLVFLISAFAMNLFNFYTFQGEISEVLSAKSLIQENSSIGFLYSPSRDKADLTGTWPLRWLNNYYTFDKQGVFTDDYFDKFFNPLVVKKKYTYNCEIYIDLHSKFLEEHKNEDSACFFEDNYYLPAITNSENYPFFDYLLVYGYKCDILPLFGEYYTLFEKNSLILLKKSN